ncbi:hypothetical protein F2P79_004368 [Pimephales promelas]|nr:hypothetical protein F2P79_004368 [Pimephales promelas]
MRDRCASQVLLISNCTTSRPSAVLLTTYPHHPSQAGGYTRDCAYGSGPRQAAVTPPLSPGRQPPLHSQAVGGELGRLTGNAPQRPASSVHGRESPAPCSSPYAADGSRLRPTASGGDSRTMLDGTADSPQWRGPSDSAFLPLPGFRHQCNKHGFHQGQAGACGFCIIARGSLNTLLWLSAIAELPNKDIDYRPNTSVVGCSDPKHFKDSNFYNLRQYKEGFADRPRLNKG